MIILHFQNINRLATCPPKAWHWHTQASSSLAQLQIALAAPGTRPGPVTPFAPLPPPCSRDNPIAHNQGCADCRTLGSSCSAHPSVRAPWGQEAPSTCTTSSLSSNFSAEHQHRTHLQEVIALPVPSSAGVLQNRALTRGAHSSKRGLPTAQLGSLLALLQRANYTGKHRCCEQVREAHSSERKLQTTGRDLCFLTLPGDTLSFRN